MRKGSNTLHHWGNYQVDTHLDIDWLMGWGIVASTLSKYKKKIIGKLYTFTIIGKYTLNERLYINSYFIDWI